MINDDADDLTAFWRDAGHSPYRWTSFMTLPPLRNEFAGAAVAGILLSPP